MATEGCNLYDLIAAKPDMCKPEPAPDQETVAEKLLDLMGRCVGTDVEILGCSIQQQVTDTTADQVGFVTVAVQPVEHLEGVLVDLAAGDLVL